PQCHADPQHQSRRKLFAAGGSSRRRRGIRGSRRKSEENPERQSDASEGVGASGGAGSSAQRFGGGNAGPGESPGELGNQPRSRSSDWPQAFSKVPFHGRRGQPAPGPGV